jgi:hypothetical protein
MMTILKYSGLLPIIGVVLMLTYIGIAAYQFGHIPMYGETDPSAFGYDGLHRAGFISLFLSMGVCAALLIVTLFRDELGEKIELFGKTIKATIIVAIVMIVSLRFLLEQTFTWYFD